MSIGFRHGQQHGLRWSRMSGEHAYSVCAFYLPSQGCRHRNANYFGKDFAIDRAVPEFSDEATNANPPSSRVLKW